MSNVVVTGANRGIGLELTRRLVARGDRVWAACRTASDELATIGATIVDTVDVADDSGVKRLVAAVGGEHVDLLVNNAGILGRETLEDLDFDAIRRQFEVNSLGPLRVTQRLLPALGRGSLVAIVTSLMGSIADNTSGGRYGYRMSKVAVNIAGVSLANDLRDRGIGVILLHPGMVATEMTGGRGISVEQSVEGLLARIDGFDASQSGRFFHADGRELPW